MMIVSAVFELSLVSWPSLGLTAVISASYKVGSEVGEHT